MVAGALADIAGRLLQLNTRTLQAASALQMAVRMWPAGGHDAAHALAMQSLLDRAERAERIAWEVRATLICAHP